MKIESAYKTATDSAGPHPELGDHGRHRNSRRFWLLILGAIALVQWPAITELYDQLSGAGFPEQTIHWHHDLKSALNVAIDQKKPILAVFGASWCPPCRTMKRDVWPRPQVSAVVEAGFVPVYVDVDDQTQADVVSQYHVSAIPRSSAA